MQLLYAAMIKVAMMAAVISIIAVATTMIAVAMHSGSNS